jgi:hypothetical protein
VTAAQILPQRQPSIGHRCVDAAESEIFQSLNPATGEALCEVRIAGPGMTSRRWQEPDRTTEAVTLP